MKLFLVLLMVFFIVSCGDDSLADKSNTQSQQPSALLNTQLDALEKAKGVEQSLQKMTDQRDEEMRKQGI